MVLPTSLLLWFGIAGIVTGLVVAAVDIAPAWQVVLFAALAFVSFFPVRWATRRLRASDETRDSTLNRRGHSAIGHQVTVIEAIEAGHGAVKFGDGRWRAASEHDMPVGTKVEVIDVEGTTLDRKSTRLNSSH